MQLIKITNIPIEYSYNVEPARLEMKQAGNPNRKTTREPAEMNIRQRNIQVRLDTTALRASLNMRTNEGFARYYASQGTQTAYQTIGESVQVGNQMGRIQDGVSIGQIIRQKMLEQPVSYTTFLPSSPPDISWQPQELNLEYDPGALHFDWQIMRNMMDYIPGKFQMNITQYPKIQIEYLGEPNYVPPSANPNYQEESV